MEYVIFFFQVEDGIRSFYLSRGLGEVYKRRMLSFHKKRRKKRLSMHLSTQTL